MTSGRESDSTPSASAIRSAWCSNLPQIHLLHPVSGCWETVPAACRHHPVPGELQSTGIIGRLPGRPDLLPRAGRASGPHRYRPAIRLADLDKERMPPSNQSTADLPAGWLVLPLAISCSSAFLWPDSLQDSVFSRYFWLSELGAGPSGLPVLRLTISCSALAGIRGEGDQHGRPHLLGILALFFRSSFDVLTASGAGILTPGRVGLLPADRQMVQQKSF